jgi:RNA polymerase sigma-70 factor (ECF subfamily)
VLESEFNSIYTANYGKVFRLCKGYFNGNEVLAEDITQEVFVKVWEHIKSFRNQASISTWIYRIAVNTCLLQLRSDKNKKINTHLPDIPDEETSRSTGYEKKLKNMYSCIHKLNSTNRAIILLELEGVPQKEIANVIGISHQALRTRITRIKNSLTKCVQENGV